MHGGHNKRVDFEKCFRGHELTEANTYKNPKGSLVCRICNREAHARYRQSEGGIAKRVELDLKRHDLTVEEFETQSNAQGGLCAICNHPPHGNRRLSVDHDHETDQNRELLCSNCNSMLGLAGDDPARLDAAAAYLRKHGK